MNRRALKPLLPVLVVIVAGLLAFLAITPAPAAVVPAPQATSIPINPPHDEGTSPTVSHTTVPPKEPKKIEELTPSSSATVPDTRPQRPCGDCTPPDRNED